MWYQEGRSNWLEVFGNKFCLFTSLEYQRRDKSPSMWTSKASLPENRCHAPWYWGEAGTAFMGRCLAIFILTGLLNVLVIVGCKLPGKKTYLLTTLTFFHATLTLHSLHSDEILGRSNSFSSCFHLLVE